MSSRPTIEHVRAFLAIELAAEVTAALADLIGQLGQANLRGVRLVRAEGIHLTLKFLGDIPRDKVSAIEASVAQVAVAHRPFTLVLGGVGVFPSRNNPRVLWVGVEGALAPLMALQQEVEGCLEALGFARDQRKFSAHLTVGRIRDGATPAHRLAAAGSLFSAQLRRGLPIQVGAVSLMRSTLLPDGALYERIASMPLTAGVASVHGEAGDQGL